LTLFLPKAQRAADKNFRTSPLFVSR